MVKKMELDKCIQCPVKALTLRNCRSEQLGYITIYTDKMQSTKTLSNFEPWLSMSAIYIFPNQKNT